MSSDFVFTLLDKGLRLLRVIVAEIKSGRIKRRKPETFLSYSEALKKLGVSYRGRAGQRLRREGLDELNEWTKAHAKLPKITGLIIDKRKKKPGAGFIKSYARPDKDWQGWWLAETDKAIDFDWSSFLRQPPTLSVPEMPEFLQRIQEKQKSSSDQIKRVTFNPEVMGGRPCIRGLRVTVGTIVGLLASHSRAKVLELYPYLEGEDIDAALRFAAWRAEERELPFQHA